MFKSLLKSKSITTIKTAAKADSAFSCLLLIPRDSAEWSSMWDNLGRHRLNEGLENPLCAENYDEVWQYMNSEKGRFGRYIHNFRHRMHPRAGQTYLKIKASRGLVIEPN